MYYRLLAISPILMSLLSFSSTGLAENINPLSLKAIDSTKKLFSSMSERKLDILEFIPKDGFIEMKKSNGPRVLKDRDFQQLYLSPMQIRLRAENTVAVSFGNTVIVTGTRIGSIFAADEEYKNESLQFTMVWVLNGDILKLRHIHFS